MRSITCRGVRGRKAWSVATLIAMLVSTGGPMFNQTVKAQTAPVGAGFALDAGDLRFIFRQIQIAQAHSAGGELVGFGPNQIPDPRLPFGLRTVDGSLNHLAPGKTLFGASDQLFPRLTTAAFKPASNAEGATAYTPTGGDVVDPRPRIISNLIVDQTVRNPAAVAVATAMDPAVTAEPLGTLPIPNVAPDVGLSAGFNLIFTFFGQFFDHGLDLVNKGGSGNVFVPLQADDPLVTHGPDGIAGNGDEVAVGTPMILSRAARAPGSSEAINQTTPFVDQNQTYTSHPSHQAFLRQYELVGGIPRSTGRMIDGAGGNIGNWAEVKAQALAMFGIVLEDAAVFNVPLLVTDAYGYLRRNAAGRPMAVQENGPGPADNTIVVLDPATPRLSSTLASSHHEFLNDIAHSAVPTAGGPDADLVAGGSLDTPQPPGTYDNELLDLHFVTGDGRGNENIFLTAVHTVFHSEHNRLRANIDALINTPGFLTAAEVAAWHATDPASGWDYGERLFQAAKFGTEMQYQHLVFEEFARRLSPSINPFIGDGINFVSELNPAIFAEFAHQTYRLGHSMLPETLIRTNADGSSNNIELLDAFLNPAAFNRNPTGGAPLTASQAAGSLFQGGARTIANELDEFVAESVRNRLVGLPLDLAVLNLARGRSEGVASLNSVRRQLFLATGDSALDPYPNWFEFAFAIKHPESLVNFIAAYGQHPTITGSMANRRAAAQALIDGDPGFMFGDASLTGLDDVDLWVGGLAEKQSPFGGLLGATFNYVFEVQLESLQNGDRFYYLERLDGLNFLSQLEGNSFAELIQRNTTLNGANSADVFSRPDFVFNMTAQAACPPGTVNPPVNCAIVDDPTTPQIETAELFRMLDGTIRYAGPAHVIWNGRNDGIGDRIWSSEGDDSLFGNGGNDRMEGGAGNDNHVGGAGDDILIDTFGDDVMKGGPGNDAISGGAGPFDLLQGNEGNDFIVGGNDTSESFGGPGNDIIYMGVALTESIGGSGDDWMEGTQSPASIAIGDDNNQFQDDPNGGHDILLAGPGDMDFDAEGGDDIMVGNVTPTHRFEGMLGFDWVTYRGETVPVDADMLVTGVLLVIPNVNENRDRFDLTEALSGSNQNDLLRGDNKVAADFANGAFGTVPNGHVLNAAGIARISGLAAILPAGATSFGAGNIILGGLGSDLIEGRGGDDIIDGDRWLNVQLRAPNPAVPGAFLRANSLHELKTDVFAGRINPGSITFIREIVTPTVSAADCAAAVPANCDRAVFTGPRADYTITVAADGTVTVRHDNGTDGTDTVRNVELLQFADITIAAPTPAPVGTPVPNIVGQTRAAAEAAILAAGLTVGVVSTRNDNNVAFGIVLDQTPLATVGVAPGSAVNFTVSLGPLVPDIHDHTVVNGVPPGFPAAQDELALSGLTLGTITRVNSERAAGLVDTQDPLPGATVAPHSAINVFVSLGPAAAGTVPAVAGLLQADAAEAIVDAGFTVGAVTFATSTTVSAGRVISTNPAAGATPVAGSAVAMVVSLGAEGLVAAFGFEELAGTTAIDSSVGPRNGAFGSAAAGAAPTRVALGKFGRAVSFDGGDQISVIDGALGTKLDLTNGMTIEAWVNPTAMSGWESVVYKERGGVGTGLLSYALYAHDGGASTPPAGYVRTNATADRGIQGLTRLPLNAWSHIAVTYTTAVGGSTLRFYVNGGLVNTVTGPNQNILQGNQPLRIGNSNAMESEGFNGMIDEVRVYNRARSAAQIQADMTTPIVP
jgi:beta-lactam-binding protein with PASTA domain